jgi:peptidoglycan/LPS O-acetylase OafA/YrhL
MSPDSRPGSPAAGLASAPFRLDIQGLRAIAVVSVVLFHAFPGLPPGGYVGVDIFFVISGYLITGILVRDLLAGRFSIARFYARRIRRLFPALLIVLIFCFVTGYVLLTPQQFEELGHTAISTAFFVSNLDFWRLTGYFSENAAEKPLLHTWSLAVEEQFYIFFPLFLYAVWRLSPRAIPAVLAVAFVVAAILGEWMLQSHPLLSYFFSPARAFELLIGCVVATTTFAFLRDPRIRNAVSFAGLAGLGAAFILYSAETPFPGVAALLPCLGAALVIAAGCEGRSAAGRLISTAPFQFFGNLSYSLYLWHWPLLAFARNLFGFDFTPVIAGSAAVLAVLFAWLSYRFVERPFLDRRADGLPYLALGVTVITLVSLTGGGVFLLHGLPSRFSPQALEMFAARGDFNPRRGECHTNDHIPYDRTCIFGDAEAPPDLAIWADSHGAELPVVLGERALRAGRSLLQITASACPPAIGFPAKDRPSCLDHNRQTLESLIADPRIRTVLLAAQAKDYADQAGLKRAYAETVRRLRQAGKSVILILPIPTTNSDPPVQVGHAVQWGNDPVRLGLPRTTYDAANDGWRAFQQDLARREQLQTVDPARELCGVAICRVFDEKAGVLYFNKDHLSVAGVRLATRALADQLYGAD